MKFVAICCVTVHLVAANFVCNAQSPGQNVVQSNTPQTAPSNPARSPAALDTAIQERLALLSSIEARIQELEQANQSLRQIFLDVQVFETPAGSLQKAGERIHHTLSSAGQAVDPDVAAKLIEELGLVSGGLRVLAQPKLAFLNGRSASLIAGGDIPVVAGYENGKPVYKYQDYGARIDVLGVLLDQNRIRLDINIRVSDLDSANSITVEGHTLPGLFVRQISTDFEMALGQTYVLAGATARQTATDVGTSAGPADSPANPKAGWGEVGAALSRLIGPKHRDSSKAECIFLVRAELIEAADAEQPRRLPASNPPAPDIRR